MNPRLVTAHLAIAKNLAVGNTNWRMGQFSASLFNYGRISAVNAAVYL